MPTYKVRWEMDIDADSPEEAALSALTIHRDPESIATFFDVFDMSKTPVECVNIDALDLELDD